VKDRGGRGAADTPLGKVLTTDAPLREWLFLAAMVHTRNEHDA
jgi:hypothetical protein